MKEPAGAMALHTTPSERTTESTSEASLRAENAEHSRSAATGADRAALAVAFASFEDASRALSTAYERLEDRCRTVNRELEQTNRDLAWSLLETEAMRGLLDRVLASVPCGILSCDSQGTITTANDRMAAFTGVRVDALRGELYANVVGGWDDIAILLAVRGAAAAEPIVREKTLVRPDGTALQVESSLCALVAPDGEVVGIVEVMNDLTSVRRLEEAVRESRTLAALGEMAAGLAHEIRNPLGGIKGFVSLLSRDLGADPAYAKILDQLTRAIDSLNRIVTDFLAFGAPARPEPRVIDLRAVALEVIALIEAGCVIADGVRIERGFPRAACCAVADRDHVKQALLNILRNAAEATPAGGRITVTISSEQNLARIIVGDTGPGIAEDAMRRLFRPFASTKPGGSGLGLAVAKALVEKNGGRLSLESGASGTRAEIALAAAPHDVDLRGGCP
jgi:PAS domain S-box-containing protein